VIPIVSNFNDAFYVSLSSIETIVVVLIFQEWRTEHVRAPYPILLCFFLTVHVLATTVANTSMFHW
jgi:hypothetical protein